MENKNNNLNLQISNEWKNTFPGATVGLLVIKNTINPQKSSALDNEMKNVENEIRNRFSDSGREGIRELNTIKAYTQHYKKFKKSYHVMLQLESVALKNRNLPRISSLVSAMFTAELKNQLLTAGHDLSKLKLPIELNTSKGSESYIGMNGNAQKLNENDMYISASEGIISSIIYGPDKRTSITSSTKDVVFTVYGTAGISPEQINQHLEDISLYVSMISSESIIDTIQIYNN